MFKWPDIRSTLRKINDFSGFNNNELENIMKKDPVYKLAITKNPRNFLKRNKTL